MALQTSDDFLFCKENRFQDKLADSSNFDNEKSVHLQGASFLTSWSGSLFLEPTGSRSALIMCPPPQTLVLDPPGRKLRHTLNRDRPYKSLNINNR